MIFPIRNCWPEACVLVLWRRRRAMLADIKKSPVSYRFQVNRLPKNGAEVSIEADEEQRAELARAHDLEAVDRFTAQLSIHAWKGDGIVIKGRVKGQITQLCVVTLDPVVSTIDEEIDSVFVPETSRLARHDEEREIILDPDADDLPESFTGDSIDIG